MGTETPAEDEWSGSLTDKAIKLEVKDGSDNFMVGGFPYTGEFSVTNHDGSPRDEEIEVCTAFYRVSLHFCPLSRKSLKLFSFSRMLTKYVIFLMEEEFGVWMKKKLQKLVRKW